MAHVSSSPQRVRSECGLVALVHVGGAPLTGPSVLREYDDGKTYYANVNLFLPASKESQLELDRSTLLLHGCYVAFVFAVMLFGALAFRQLSDNLDVRRLRMGEDRTCFISAPGVCISIAGLFIAVLCAAYLIARPQNQIYFYALPLILAVQFSQILTRTYLQRTLVKTHGFVFRSIAFESIKAVRYENVVRADFEHLGIWTKVTLSIVDDQIHYVTFRIFPFSEASLMRVLDGWCGCQIRRVHH